MFEKLSLAGKSAVELFSPKAAAAAAAEEEETEESTDSHGDDIYYLQIHQYTGYLFNVLTLFG